MTEILNFKLKNRMLRNQENRSDFSNNNRMDSPVCMEKSSY